MDSEKSDAQLIPTGAYPIDVNSGLLKRDRILLQDTHDGSIFIGFGRRQRLFRLVEEAERLAKEYNQNEDRDRDGRWSSNGGTSSASADAAAIGVTSGQAGISDSLPKIVSIFSDLATGAVEALTSLAETFAVPTAFLGAYFIPFGRSAVASGTLPGHPDITFHYDSDEGHFSLYDAEHELLFTGVAGGDGLIRTEDGDVIGRRVDGTVLIDTNILPDEQTYGAETDADAESSAQSQAQASADTSKPSLCPVPLPDRPGFKSSRSQAYQRYVNNLVNPEHPIPLGLAAYFINRITRKAVAFDDCQQTNGHPDEAKGPGIERMIKNEKMARFLTFSFTRQAERQVDAAPGRQIDWYVAEPEAAEFFRRIFSTPKLASIHVYYAPMQTEKIMPMHRLPAFAAV